MAHKLVYWLCKGEFNDDSILRRHGGKGGGGGKWGVGGSRHEGGRRGRLREGEKQTQGWGRRKGGGGKEEDGK